MIDTLPLPFPDSKKCIDCGEFKPLSEFYVKVKKTGQLYPRCRKCFAKVSHDRFVKNPAAFKASGKKWRAKNPDRHEAYQKMWREQNPEKRKAIEKRADLKRRPQKAAYRAANAEKIKSSRKAYKLANAAIIKEKNKAYYAANAKAINKRIAKSVAANPELYRQIHRGVRHRRKVRLTNNGPTEKFHDVEIFERDNWICKLCDKPIDRAATYPHPMSVSLDHVLPIARGGGHTRANSQCAHLRCNSSKNCRDVILSV